MSNVKASLVSVYLVREAPGGMEVLLLQRCADHTFPGDWQGVHGHIERDETAWQTALRELQEETGIDPVCWFRLVRAGNFYEPDTDTVYLVPSFAAVAPAGADFRLSDEHQAAEWRPLSEARDRFRWVTQRDDMDAIIAGTKHWPATGPELERMDLDRIRKRWAERGDRAQAPRGLD